MDEKETSSVGTIFVTWNHGSYVFLFPSRGMETRGRVERYVVRLVVLMQNQAIHVIDSGTDHPKRFRFLSS